MIARVCFVMDGLNPCGIIDMRYSRNIRARHIQFLDTKQRLFFLAHGQPPLLDYICDHQHIGAVFIQFKPVPDILAQH